MPNVIMLATAPLNAAGDTLAVELHRPPDTPPFVLIVWPAAPTVSTPPERFPGVALAVIALLDSAMITFYATEAGR